MAAILTRRGGRMEWREPSADSPGRWLCDGRAVLEGSVMQVPDEHGRWIGVRMSTRDGGRVLMAYARQPTVSYFAVVLDEVRGIRTPLRWPTGEGKGAGEKGRKGEK